MAAKQPKPPRIAFDTNFLLDLADGNEKCLDCIDVLGRKNAASEFIVTPTVLQELEYLAEYGDAKEDKQLAGAALDSLISRGFKPLNFIAVGHGIVEQISREMLKQGLLPTTEKNDSLLVAEAALSGCDILISSDSHIADMEREPLRILLESFDVKPVAVLRPRQVIRQLENR